MISAVVAIAVDMLGDAIAYAGKHPEAAINMVRVVKAALMDAHAADALPEAQRREKLTGLAAGLAAARANAVQEYVRRQKKAATK